MALSSMETAHTVRCPVLHKSGSDQQTRDIAVQLDQSAMTNTPSKRLKVVLTCDDDPFFHFTLTLQEEGFAALRCSQALLVEFGQFPRTVLELLQRCISPTGDAGAATPRFCLHLDTSSGDAQLEVVEVTPFRQLTHLSLRLAAAADTDLKLYLAAQLHALKETVQQERERLSTAERAHTSQLRHTQELLAQRVSELEAARAQLQLLQTDSSQQLQRQLAEQREQARQAEWQLKQQHETERKTAEEAARQATAQLELKASALDRQCRQLTDFKYQCELQVKELETQLKAVQTENRQLKQELSGVKKQNASLDEEYHGKSKAAQQLKTRVAVLETEARDQQQLLHRQEQLHHTAMQNSERLETQLAELQSTLTRREHAVKTVSQDLLKANDIIRKLQAETRGNHAKLKVRSQIALQQERLLAEAGDARQELEQRLQQAETRQKESADAVAQLQTERDQLQSRVEAADKLHKTNENVINWLNKQLNEQAASQTRRPPVTGQFASARPLNASSGASAPVSGAWTPASGAWTPASALSTPPLRQPPQDSLTSYNSSAATGADSSARAANKSDPLPSGNAKPKSKLGQDENKPPALAPRYLQAANQRNRIAGLVRRSPPPPS